LRCFEPRDYLPVRIANPSFDQLPASKTPHRAFAPSLGIVRKSAEKVPDENGGPT